MGYTISIDIDAIKHFIDALKPKDRIQVLEYLEENLWKSKMNKIVAEMQKYTKKNNITDSEIDRICEEARKKHHGKD